MEPEDSSASQIRTLSTSEHDITMHIFVFHGGPMGQVLYICRLKDETN
jgi:hypothetical protein